jgi:isocitrate/isopropylmalate dehydrogenase
VLLSVAEVTIFTRVGIKRIATYAFQLAQARPRKLLTYVTKSNAMRNGMVLWDEVINEVAKDFPDVVSVFDRLSHVLAVDRIAYSRRWTTCWSMP